ncbi:HNH endonuclease signature motif containing protein [Pseudoflavitalea rhizosphaerae]|uniref:HNH endonuclease n=1 Tax=Pseudoflavitalea rhizosphaerae TaxID=1884793 RepID=UPI000F8F7591
MEPHYKSGDNSSCNGLLLRVDIHKLFDDGLIAINPNTFEVAIHESLLNTVYRELSGNSLLERLDGNKPNEKFLLQRWKERK